MLTGQDCSVSQGGREPNFCSQAQQASESSDKTSGTGASCFSVSAGRFFPGRGRAPGAADVESTLRKSTISANREQRKPLIYHLTYLSVAELGLTGRKLSAELEAGNERPPKLRR